MKVSTRFGIIKPEPVLSIKPLDSEWYMDREHVFMDDDDDESEDSFYSSDDESMVQHKQIQDILFRCGACADDFVNYDEGFEDSLHDFNKMFVNAPTTNAMNDFDNFTPLDDGDVKTRGLENDGSFLVELIDQKFIADLIQVVEEYEVTPYDQDISVPKTKKRNERAKWLHILKKSSKPVNHTCQIQYLVKSDEKKTNDYSSDKHHVM
jgi:hypothetical protein